MNAVLEEKYIDVQEVSREKYEYADFDEVMRISDRLIEQHREAYTALANA